MAVNTPPHAPHFSNNVPTIMGVIGTQGTSDTQGTARALPFSIDPVTGAAFVNIIGTQVTIGGGTTTISNPTGFNGGTVAIGTSPTELTFTGVTKGILITADHNNGTMIYIGPSSVAQDGANAIVRLDPGESLAVDIDDTSAAFYAVGGTTAQKLYKVALT